MSRPRCLAHFRANGKILLSAEYAVLHGARGLAIPSKLGQLLSVLDDPSSSIILWQSLNEQGDVWWSGSFPLDLTGFCSNDPIANRLGLLLSLAKKQNPQFLVSGCKVKVVSEFDLAWGLGSSSTLVSLIAQWAGVDPYSLQFQVFGGSGYDIACATATKPLVYTRWPVPKATPVGFHPPFVHKLYLAFLGQKRNSREAIANLPQRSAAEWDTTIGQINLLTDSMVKCVDMFDFMDILKDHETLIGEAIGVVPVQESHFSQFPGQIKSLGAWGGDMVLVATDLSFPKVQAYFAGKGIGQVFPAAQFLYFG